MKVLNHFFGSVNYIKRVQLFMLCLALCFCAQASENDSVTVYVFLSETCPICQNNTIELRRVYEQYRQQGVEFIGVFPNKGLSTEATVKKFTRNYNLNFEMKLDGEHKLVQQYNATTTPQVFVVHKATGQVLYSGRIDNSFEALGKRREVITERYLNNALNNIILNKPVQPAVTKPVGCFISQL